ncbi:MAG: adenine phosphoribosyltransferase [Pirellulaceae bacterium]|nr:adenine phosphoribosyltransferase [Pirellulaceae bacterium]
MDLKEHIRDVPDFPKEGIVFKDITPLLSNAAAFSNAIKQFAEKYRGENIDAIVAAEARGFIFGAPLALELQTAFVPVRKPGKLPFQTESITYDLEYGTDTLEMHIDGVSSGQRVLIVDDLLATGGTVEACCKLVEQTGATVVGCAFLVELQFLNAAQRLNDYDVFSLLQY